LSQISWRTSRFSRRAHDCHSQLCDYRRMSGACRISPLLGQAAGPSRRRGAERPLQAVRYWPGWTFPGRRPPAAGLLWCCGLAWWWCGGQGHPMWPVFPERPDGPIVRRV